MEHIQTVAEYLKNLEIRAFMRTVLNKKLIAKLAAAGFIGYGVFYFG